MTDKELKALKENLWHAADVLRAGAHLAANKYGQPILGLILLRYADILFKQHKDEIEAEYNRTKGGRAKAPWEAEPAPFLPSRVVNRILEGTLPSPTLALG